MEAKGENGGKLHVCKACKQDWKTQCTNHHIEASSSCYHTTYLFCHHPAFIFSPRYVRNLTVKWPHVKSIEIAPLFFGLWKMTEIQTLPAPSPNAHLWRNMFQTLNDYSTLGSFRLQYQLP